MLGNPTASVILLAWATIVAVALQTVQAQPIDAQTAEANTSQGRQIPDSLGVELNKLEPQGGACRAYLLVDNSRGAGVQSLKLDLFAIDQDGVAARRVAVELGPVSGRRTQFRLFDFAGISCDRIGRILMNDVLSCSGADSAPGTCVDGLALSSRSVPFTK